MPTECCTFWTGLALGAVERACLRSAIRQGHAVSLYCYRPPAGLPTGVVVRDAADILPPETAVALGKSSAALFSDRFRLELQRRGAGTWIDCDVYLLRPLPGEQPYLMGKENHDGLIGTAVLRLPPDSPLVPALLMLFEERQVPFWIGRRARALAYLRLWKTGRSGLAQMPWGAAGPLALTALAKRYGLSGRALPPDRLFPVPWQDAAWIRDPARRLDQVATSETLAIHLYNQLIQGFKDEPAEPGSFLARLQEEGQPD